MIEQLQRFLAFIFCALFSHLATPLDAAASNEITFHVIGSHGHEMKDIQIAIYTQNKLLRKISTQDAITKVFLNNGGYVVKVGALSHNTSSLNLVVDKAKHFIPVCVSLTRLGSLSPPGPANLTPRLQTLRGRLIRSSEKPQMHWVRLVGMYCEYNLVAPISTNGMFEFHGMISGLYALHVVGPSGFVKTEIVTVRDSDSNQIFMSID